MRRTLLTLLPLLACLLLPVASAESGTTDGDYSHQLPVARLTGIVGACAVTTISGNLGGRSNPVLGWRGVNLYPETATTLIVDCDTGSPIVVDQLRFDQTWTDPTCTLKPDSDPISPVRGDYSEAVGKPRPDGWWRIPVEDCNAGRDRGITGAVGIATGARVSAVAAVPPRYRIVWDHPHFWTVGRNHTDRFCLDATMKVTVSLRGHVGSARVPSDLVCVAVA